MKTVRIEELLTWAFTNELCKVGGGGDGLTAVLASNFGMTREMATLGTLIDKSPNLYGVIPGFIEDGDPHPDAVKVGDAVRDLAMVGFDIPEGWMPFPEFEDPHGLIVKEVERVVAEVRLKWDRLSGRHLVGLVTRAAILGHGPDWSCRQPCFRMVSSQGKPRWFLQKTAKDAFGRVYTLETDGYDARRGRPRAGAYRKYELSEMMRGDILSRLDWQLWQDALSELRGWLTERLEAHRIAPFVPDRQPWARMRNFQPKMKAIENIAK